jgi:hypothetical protein
MWALAAILTAGPAPSQEVDLVVSGGRVTDGRGGERSGVALSPGIAWTDGRSSIAVRGSATLLDGGEPLWGGGLSGAVEMAAVGPVSADVAGSGGVVAAEGWTGAAGRISPRVGVSGIGWTVLAGPVWGMAGERTGRSESAGGLLPVGGSREVESRTRAYDGVAAEARLLREMGVLTGRWSGVRSEGSEWQELSVGATALVRGMALGGEAGIRVGDMVGGWGGASAAVPLGGGAALVVEAGRYPADVLLERPGGQYATIGLRVRGKLDGGS